MREWLACAAVAVALISTPAFADEVKIDDLVVATTMPAAQRDATVKAAKALYQFWNTGDEASLKLAISPNFTDHTLPAGRRVRQARPSPRRISARRCPISASRSGS